MATRRIVVRPAGTYITDTVPVRRVVETTESVPVERVVETTEPVPVERVVRTTEPAEYELQQDQVTIGPNEIYQPETQQTLDYWMQRFAPSIARVLPSRNHVFTPRAVSVERKIFYRDELPEETVDGVRLSAPRRVRVKQERVTLFGTVRRPG